MKKNCLKNWSILRYARMALALVLLVNAYETRQWIFAVFGLFFLGQALLNWGCGAQGCSIEFKKKTDEQ